MDIYYSKEYGKYCKESKESSENITDVFSSEALLQRVLYMHGYDGKIERSVHGKIFLVDAPDLHLSITHTGNLWSCAFHSSAVGIDVESINGRLRDWRKLASRFFSPDECKFLEGLQNEEELKKSFLRMWTMKEAALKLLGIGIAGGLNSISVAGEVGLLFEASNLYFYEAAPFLLDGFVFTVCTEESMEHVWDVGMELPVLTDINYIQI